MDKNTMVLKKKNDGTIQKSMELSFTVEKNVIIVNYCKLQHTSVGFFSVRVVWRYHFLCTPKFLRSKLSVAFDFLHVWRVEVTYTCKQNNLLLKCMPSLRGTF